MAQINDLGNVTAKCPGCSGALAAFGWRGGSGAQYGAITHGNVRTGGPRGETRNFDYRLFKCGGCGRGALGVVSYQADSQYPGAFRTLLHFHPQVNERLKLPDGVPDGIVKEFREGESCLDADCDRAAAAMFRSVLDKTLRANGYKVKNGTTLEQQIDMAADDGVITEARRRKAHEEVRVLGNDVLHDEWHAIVREDVLAARHYAQRVLEDFYDDRNAALKILQEKNRLPK